MHVLIIYGPKYTDSSEINKVDNVRENDYLKILKTKISANGSHFSIPANP